MELSLNPSMKSRSIPSGTATATIGKAAEKDAIIISTSPPVPVLMSQPLAVLE